jgi:hypothetical protein
LKFDASWGVSEVQADKIAGLPGMTLTMSHLLVVRLFVLKGWQANEATYCEPRALHRMGFGFLRVLQWNVDGRTASMNNIYKYF